MYLVRYNYRVLSFASLGFSSLTLGLIAFGFGAIIGSFLNVVIYRLHTGRSLEGRSHCLSCAAPLRVYELVPLLSYLGLRGRCGHCGARFTSRYFLVELLTASLFSLTVLTFDSVVTAGFVLAAVTLLVVVFVYDLRHMIIPDEYVVALMALVVADAGYSAFVVTGSWIPFLYDALAASLASLFFFGLWYVSKGRWIGFGDVKLAFPLALLVGSGGVFSMVVLSFWIGAGVSLLILGMALLLRRARGKMRLPFIAQTLTMKSAVPFAPFLIVGCLVVLFFQVDVLTFFYYDFSY